MEFERDLDNLITFIKDEHLGKFKYLKDDSEFEIVFNDTEDLDYPTSNQINALNYFKENSELIAKSISEFIFEEREPMEEVFGDFNEANFEGFPYLKSSEEVFKYISFSSIYIHSDAKDNISFIGLTGNCTWDSEHGLGLVIYKNKIVDFAGWDCGYSYYCDESKITEANVAEIFGVGVPIFKKPLTYIEVEENQKLEYLKLYDWLVEKRSIYGLRSTKVELSEIEKIKLLQNLRSLELRNKNIEEVPREMILLKKLRYLDLSFNKIKNLPSYLSELISLDYLNISGNEISEIPEPFEKLINLTSLDLYLNSFKSLPFPISKMTLLERLDCSDNQIKEIPNWIENLKELEDFRITNNYLTNIPKQVLSLSKLRLLVASKNKFSFFQKKIIQNRFNDKFDLVID